MTVALLGTGLAAMAILAAPAVNVTPPTRVTLYLDKAAARRVSQGETLILSVSYYAERAIQRDASLADLRDVTVDVAPRQEWTLHGPGVFNVPSYRFNPYALAVDTRNYRLNVSVWSGRVSSNDNVFDCNTYDEPVTGPARRRVAIYCRLLHLE